MHELSLYRATLGAEFDRLALVLQRHYDIESGHSVVIEGELTAWNRFPMLRLFAPFLPKQQKNVPVTATLRSVHDRVGRVCLEWTREFSYKSGLVKSVSIQEPPPSPLVVPSILEKFVQRYRPNVGLTLMLDPSTDGGALATVSVGPQYVITGPLMRRLPGLARLRVDAAETAINATEFYTDTAVSHPLLGRLFGYSGRLHLRN